MAHERDTDPAPTTEGIPDSDGAGELRTFLIADVRGYTRYTQAHGDEAAADLAARFARGARAAVDEHGGRVIELRGDEALAVFTSPRQAVRAAIEVQRRLRGARDSDDALPLGVGIGVDTGEAVAVEGGFRGKALNVAARLCSLAGPGEVLVTETLSTLAGRVPGVRYALRKPVRVKGIDQPVRLLEAVPEQPLPPLPAPEAPGLEKRRRLVLSGAVAAVAVAGAAALFFALGGEGEAAALEANSVGLLDTGSGAVREQIAVGAAPVDIVAGAGSLWVVNRQEASLSRVDPESKTVADRIPVGGAPLAAAFGDEAVWVVDGVGRRLVRVAAGTGSVVTSYEVGNGASAVAFAAGAAWVANTVDGTVTRVDAQTGKSRSVTVGLEPVALAADERAVWVANRGSNNVVRVDAGSLALEPVPVGHEPAAVTVGGGAVWVAAAADGTVWKIDRERASVERAIPVGPEPRALAYADGAAWVASEAAGTVSRIADDGKVTRSAVGGAPTALEAVGDELWVTALASRASHRGGTLRIVGGFPITDPCCSSFGANINPLLNDGLVGFRVTGGPGGTTLVPNLAIDIPKPTDGGRRYRFRLRRGIRYSTGAEVKASHFRATLERSFAARADEEPFFESLRGAPACLESPRQCDLSQSVIADDDAGTVTFVLEAPDPSFLYQLAYPPAWVLPPDVPRRRVEITPLPATGPYRILEVVPNQRMTLVRNPYFREWSRAAQPAGFPDRIVIGGPVEPQEALGRVRSNRADALFGELPAAAVEELRVRFPTRLYAAPTNSILFAMLNTKVAPFDDERVRRALSLAVDRRAAIASLGGPLYGRPACQMIPPNVLGFRPYCPHTRQPGLGVWTAPDLSEARRLVSASGTRGRAVTVWTSRWPPFRGLAGVVAAALRKLNYRVDLRVIGGATFDYYNRFGESATAQVGPFRWLLGFPTPSDLFGVLFHCEFGLNAAKFCDPSIDERAEAASVLTATDPSRAATQWAAIDKEVVDRAAAIPLANLGHLEFVSERIGNVQQHPVWGPIYGQMWVR